MLLSTSVIRASSFSVSTFTILVFASGSPLSYSYGSKMCKTVVLSSPKEVFRRQKSSVVKGTHTGVTLY